MLPAYTLMDSNSTGNSKPVTLRFTFSRERLAEIREFVQEHSAQQDPNMEVLVALLQQLLSVAPREEAAR